MREPEGDQDAQRQPGDGWLADTPRAPPGEPEQDSSSDAWSSRVATPLLPMDDSDIDAFSDSVPGLLLPSLPEEEEETAGPGRGPPTSQASTAAAAGQPLQQPVADGGAAAQPAQRQPLRITLWSAEQCIPDSTLARPKRLSARQGKAPPLPPLAKRLRPLTAPAVQARPRSTPAASRAATARRPQTAARQQSASAPAAGSEPVMAAALAARAQELEQRIDALRQGPGAEGAAHDSDASTAAGGSSPAPAAARQASARVPRAASAAPRPPPRVASAASTASTVRLEPPPMLSARTGRGRSSAGAGAAAAGEEEEEEAAPFRANPVPKSTREPRFKLLVLLQKARRMEAHQRRVEALKAKEKPFSFASRASRATTPQQQSKAAAGHATDTRSPASSGGDNGAPAAGRSASPPKRPSPTPAFRAKAVPASNLKGRYQALLQEQRQRREAAAARSRDTLASAAPPPRMAQQSARSPPPAAAPAPVPAAGQPSSRTRPAAQPAAQPVASPHTYGKPTVGLVGLPPLGHPAEEAATHTGHTCMPEADDECDEVSRARAQLQGMLAHVEEQEAVRQQRVAALGGGRPRTAAPTCVRQTRTQELQLKAAKAKQEEGEAAGLLQQQQQHRPATAAPLSNAPARQPRPATAVRAPPAAPPAAAASSSGSPQQSATAAAAAGVPEGGAGEYLPPLPRRWESSLPPLAEAPAVAMPALATQSSSPSLRERPSSGRSFRRIDVALAARYEQLEAAAQQERAQRAQQAQQAQQAQGAAAPAAALAAVPAAAPSPDTPSSSPVPGPQPASPADGGGGRPANPPARPASAQLQQRGVAAGPPATPRGLQGGGGSGDALRRSFGLIDKMLESSRRRLAQQAAQLAQAEADAASPHDRLRASLVAQAAQAAQHQEMLAAASGPARPPRQGLHSAGAARPASRLGFVGSPQQLQPQEARCPPCRPASAAAGVRRPKSVRFALDSVQPDRAALTAAAVADDCPPQYVDAQAREARQEARSIVRAILDSAKVAPGTVQQLA